MTESETAEGSNPQQQRESLSPPIRWAKDNSIRALKLLVVLICFYPVAGFLLIFCVVAGIFVGIYCCVSKEPRPLRALFRSTDEPAPAIEKPSLTREEVLKFLIVRKLLEVDPVTDPQDIGDDHEAICEKEGSISVKAENIILRFSTLIAVDDDESETAVPKYHMPISSVSSGDSVSQAEGEKQEDLDDPKSKSLCDNKLGDLCENSESIDDLECMAKGSQDMVEKDSSIIDIGTDAMTSDQTSENASVEFGFPDVENRSSACCDICFTDYEIGDKVAWSRNPSCIHAYHQACILDWLQQKTTCPICRNDYQYEKDIKESS